MANALVPALELHRINDTLIVRLEMPGVDVSDAIDVEVVGTTLHVKALRRAERGGFGTHFESSEFRSGTYARDVDLPAPVLEESLEATYRSGVLTVRMIVDPTPSPRWRVVVRREP